MPFHLIPPKLVLTVTLYSLWLIISSYVLYPHILSVSSFLHKKCHLLLYSRRFYRLLLLFLLFLFHIYNRNIIFRSFYYLYARSSLNYFIYISESRFYIYLRSQFIAIPNLATKLLISTFMKSISCIALQQQD